MSIADTVKRAIKEEGYTQTAVAKKMNMNPKTFSAMLNGRKLILPQHIPPLCRILKITPNELFEFDSNQDAS